MADYTLVHFRVQEDDYIFEEYMAYGTDPDKMRVYLVREDYHRKTAMLYPSCMKFIVPDRLSEPLNTTKEEIEKTYGPRLGRREMFYKDLGLDSPPSTE